MRGWIYIFLLCATGSLCATGGDRELRVSGDIAIDASGAVGNCTVTSEVPDTIKQVVCGAVGKWRFQPVVVNGVAMPATSKMFLTLLAHKTGENYELRVKNASFSDSRKKALSMQPPYYPHAAMRLGVMADVLVAVRVGADGKVIEAMAAQTPWLNTHSKGRVLQQWQKIFEDATIAAAKHWTWPPLDPAMHGKGESTILVPVSYRVGEPGHDMSEIGWTSSSTTARPIPWLEKEHQDYDASRLREGQQLAIGGGHELLTDVAGKAL